MTVYQFRNCIRNRECHTCKIKHSKVKTGKLCLYIQTHFYCCFICQILHLVECSHHIPYAINQDLSTDFNSSIFNSFLKLTYAQFCFSASHLLFSCATELCNEHRCHTYFKSRFTNRNIACTNCFLPKETVEYFLTYKLYFNFPLPCWDKH